MRPFPASGTNWHRPSGGTGRREGVFWLIPHRARAARPGMHIRQLLSRGPLLLQQVFDSPLQLGIIVERRRIGRSDLVAIAGTAGSDIIFIFFSGGGG